MVGFGWVTVSATFCTTTAKNGTTIHNGIVHHHTLGAMINIWCQNIEKTLGWLRQSLAHDLAPNMVKLLCIYLIWFGMKHGIKTDPMFFHKTGMLFYLFMFLPQT